MERYVLQPRLYIGKSVSYGQKSTKPIKEQREAPAETDGAASALYCVLVPWFAWRPLSAAQADVTNIALLGGELWMGRRACPSSSFATSCCRLFTTTRPSLALIRIGPFAACNADRAIETSGSFRKTALDQVLIVIGETGSGKTTQITQYLAEADPCCLAGSCWCTRRVSVQERLCCQCKRGVKTSPSSHLSGRIHISRCHWVHSASSCGCHALHPVSGRLADPIQLWTAQTESDGLRPPMGSIERVRHATS